MQCPLFLLCALPVLGLYWWLQHFYRCSSRELQRLESLSRAPVFSHFSDTLPGLATIRSFRVQPRYPAYTIIPQYRADNRGSL